MMTFHAMGMGMRHEGDFYIDRPDGSGDNLLLIFKTNAIVNIDGEDISAPPDSAILYSKGYPQKYRTCGKVYINHFLHCDCCDNDEFHSTTNFPFDTVIELGDSSAAEEIMRMLSKEKMSDSLNKPQYIDMLMRILFLKIGDCGCHRNYPTITNTHSNALNSLRAEIYSNPSQFGSVEELARSVSLSPSHFQQLYRTQFGISCYEDLLTARIKTAQYYLRSTSISVREIALLCGYENDVCFMRRFKQRTGVTAQEYREIGK